MKKSLNSLVTVIIFLFSTSAMTTPIQWGNTGHWYEFIDTNVNVDQAFSLARSSSFMGMEGYLATITTKNENWFVSNKIAEGSVAWLGGAGDGAIWT